MESNPLATGWVLGRLKKTEVAVGLTTKEAIKRGASRVTMIPQGFGLGSIDEADVSRKCANSNQRRKMKRHGIANSCVT